MASDVKLALSMRIARHGGDTEVAVAAKVSLVWEYTGEMDGLNSTVALEAVNALRFGPQAADKHSTRRAGPGRIPPNVSSYFAQIARNKCLDAVKVADARPVIPFEDGDAQGVGAEEAADPADNPLSMLEMLEQLDALGDCMSRLSEEDRVLCAEIGLIVEKRWREAAERLGMAESTLRSRWRGVLGRLRACLEKKIPKKTAPEADSGDS